MSLNAFIIRCGSLKIEGPNSDSTEFYIELEYNGNKETPMLAKAGDVGFFVSDIWHRRMPAKAGDKGRFFLQAHYGRRDIAQRLLIPDECHQLTPEAIARMTTDRDRTVAGLHPRLFYDG